MSNQSIDIHDLTLADAARLLGISERALHRRQDRPERKDNNRFDGTAVVQWARDNAYQEGIKRATIEATGIEADEAACMKYKALRLAVAYEKEVGKLVDKNCMGLALKASFLALRKLGEDLQKQFGSDAYDMFIEVLNDSRAAAIAVIEGYKPPSSGPADLDDDEEPEVPRRPAKGKPKPTAKTARKRVNNHGK